MEKKNHVVVLEVSNATDDEIQIDLGRNLSDFCQQNRGTGITATVLSDELGHRVKSIINERGNQI
ncbi:hypothetical protein ACTWQB_14800 [Piscibacillus sp. B03]|uniref:hypothetical protein n=1 Tax=Piscibacillus sp. B03 TaxID=3457430 RepID=UPI003FCE1B61